MLDLKFICILIASPHWILIPYFSFSLHQVQTLETECGSRYEMEINCKINLAKWIQCWGCFSLGSLSLFFSGGVPKFEFSSSHTLQLEEWAAFHLQHLHSLCSPKSQMESMLINSAVRSRRWRAFDSWLPVDFKVQVTMGVCVCAHVHVVVIAHKR